MHPDATWYLVCYDIAEDPTRTRVYKTLRGYGEHLQYSVFRCALTPSKLVILRSFLEDQICQSTDQVILLKLGRAARASSWDAVVVGKPLPPIRRGARIISDDL